MNGRRSPFYYSIRHIFMWNFLPPHRFTYPKFLQLFYFQLLGFYCTCSTVRNGANFNGIFLLKKMATSLSVQLQGRCFGEYSLFKWADCNSIRLNWIGFIVICTPTCWHRKKITGEAFKYSNFACYVTALHQIDFFSLAIDFGSKLSSSWHICTLWLDGRAAIPGISRRRLAPSFVISTAIRILLTTVSPDRSAVKGLWMERSTSSRTLCVKVQCDT